MCKLLGILLSSACLNSMAMSIYLDPLYTVAISTGHYESANQTRMVQNLTPIVYKDRYLPSGKNLLISCNGPEAVINLIANYEVNIPIHLWNVNNQEVACTSPSADIIWSNDDYKIKSESIVEIQTQTFNDIPFMANNSLKLKGRIISITSDGNLTNITVNDSQAFPKAQFYGIINGKRYLLQYSSAGNKFIVHAANLQKLLLTDSNGVILISLTFPNYE